MIIGVDPGKSGACALVDTSIIIDIFDMPWRDKQVDAAELADMLSFWRNIYEPDCLIIEQVHAMPRQGVSSTFQFGVSYGIVIGCAYTLGFDVEFVTPQKWKKALGLSSDKDESRLLASRLWPDNKDSFSRKKDDGRAEAALIAHWKEEHDAS
jgi:Holliday junction resolvasome RuvABC endonuclease subunit